MPMLNQASARRVPPSGVRKLAATRMRPASSSKRKECGGGLSTGGACVLAAATKATRQSSITSGGSSRRNKGISAFLPRKGRARPISSGFTVFLQRMLGRPPSCFRAARNICVVLGFREGVGGRMKALLIGSGGREHAIANALVKSPRLDRLFVAPGNPGMSIIAESVALDAKDHRAVVAFCRSNDVGLVVVGPEQPLVEGLVDALNDANVLAFGPSRLAARLEGSKGFTKDLCRAAGIPTADYARFDEEAAALAYIQAKGAPLVLKADGLAAGKGVVVAESLQEAEAALRALFE